MIIERCTIMNGILYTISDYEFKTGKVTDYTCYNITLKNTKTNRNKRWLIKCYEITEKEIVIKLLDETVKRYQTNEWIIVHTSTHYF